MRILANTNSKQASAATLMEQIMPLFEKKGHEVSYNQWKSYAGYDIILFVASDSEVLKAKKENPDAIVGIIDPKIMDKKMDDVRAADFLCPTSIEQKDKFVTYNSNLHVYFHFPDICQVDKSHAQKGKTIIAYHGNKIHLDNMNPRITEALNHLSKEHEIELWLMYNIEKLKKNNNPEKALSKDIYVRHIQWSMENYTQELSKADIGIVPAFITIDEAKAKNESQIDTGLFSGMRGYNFGYFEEDNIVRYKYSTNPGRIYVFAQLSIPVVADYFPSACQMIRDEHSGLLVRSEDGWRHALQSLISDPKKRNKYSKNLKITVDSVFSIEKNFQALCGFLQEKFGLPM